MRMNSVSFFRKSAPTIVEPMARPRKSVIALAISVDDAGQALDDARFLHQVTEHQHADQRVSRRNEDADDDADDDHQDARAPADLARAIGHADLRARAVVSRRIRRAAVG